jgi:general secretion pathway protein J
LRTRVRTRGFTLIELMSALVILSLLAVMSFRGLGAVLDARDQVRQETEKWRRVATFFARLQRDVQLSTPTPLRGTASSFELNRFAAAEGVDAPRQVAYGLNQNHGVELAKFELQYLDTALAWRDAWPAAESSPPLPQALRVRLVLASGEELVRVFAFRQ